LLNKIPDFTYYYPSTKICFQFIIQYTLIHYSTYDKLHFWKYAMKTPIRLLSKLVTVSLTL